MRPTRAGSAGERRTVLNAAGEERTNNVECISPPAFA